MQVAVLGQGPRAAAHRAWYAGRGVTLLSGDDSPGAALPAAELYHLCEEAPDGLRPLRALLRRRRVAVLVAGPLSPDPAEAARLARQALQRRSALATTGGWRWVPAFARLRELVAGGIVGVVRRVDVAVTAAPDRQAETRWGAIDLGWWLAGDGPLAASAGGTFGAGAAQVTVRVAPGAEGDESVWSVALDADLGQAAAETTFAPWRPGSVCRNAAAWLAPAGRRRELSLPAADPVAGELAAVLARQGAGLAWLGVCQAERAGAIGGLVGAVPSDRAGKTPGCG